MIHDDEPPNLNHKEPVDDWIDLMLHSRSARSDHQHDLPDPQLLQELQALSKEQAQTVNDRVARVWRQLEARAGLSADGQRQDIPPAWPLSPQERISPMQNPTPLVRAPRRWSARLSALVAAALLIVLVGGLVIGLVLVRHSDGQTAHPQSSATATRASTPPATSTPEGQLVPVLENLTMLDAQHGWALNNPVQVTQTPGSATVSTTNIYQVLITSDGGNHWRNVTPSAVQGLPSKGPLITPDFVTPLLAWLFVGINQLYVTTDGGQSWQQATVPETDQYGGLSGSNSFTFVNAQDGWVLLSTGNATALLGTTDGGKHWVKLQSTDAQGGTGAGSLPLKHIEWLSFIDASTGWATGENARSDGVVRLYVTHDGGATWQPQSAPLPAQGFSGPTVDALAPEFFTAQDGILDVLSSSAIFQPEVASHPQSGVLGRTIYVTHDGGATWQIGALLPEEAAIVSFSDANHGWAASGDNADIWATSDGGRTWAKIFSGNLTAYAGGGGIGYSALDFVSSQVGWAERDGPNYSELLFKTADGGRTWSQINYSVSG